MILTEVAGTPTEVAPITEEMIETVDSNAMTEATTIATVAIGNVKNVEIRILHSDKNATDAESPEEIPTGEATTETVDSNVMTAATTIATVAIGNVQNVEIRILHSGKNATDAESPEETPT